jgi:DNA-binding NtrC family response regulator
VATILLVDNDPLQASLRLSILVRRFADVQRVRDAAEAFCLIEQPHFAEKLGLVISGHHMPGIGGPAFVAELHARMPEVKVLVLGGAGENATDYAGSEVCFRRRPIPSEELLDLASKMLAHQECSAV